MDFVIFPDFSLLDIHPTLDLPYIAISFYLVQVLFSTQDFWNIRICNSIFTYIGTRKCTSYKICLDCCCQIDRRQWIRNNIDTKWNFLSLFNSPTIRPIAATVT